MLARRQFDEDARLEIDAHLDALTQRYQRQGMSPDEAYVAARRQFGNTIRLRQDLYEMNSIGWIERMRQDLRHAFRGLRRDRAYSATIVLTLALTIGATTAVFSIVDATLLKPLPFDDAARLVSIRERWREVGDRPMEVNERHFEHWRSRATSFAALAQFGMRPMNLTGAGDALPVTIVRASGSLFDVLRTPISIGRGLLPNDDAEAAPDVVVLTDKLWRQRFDAKPQVVGRSITLDGRTYTIVGVLPAAFRLPRRDAMTAEFDAIIPLRVSVGWFGDHNNQAVGRLRDGNSIEQAQAELDVMQADVAAIASKDARRPITLSGDVLPLSEYVVSGSRRGLLLLLASSTGVLLIACFNLANLSLARSIGRRREVAMLSALGASRTRIVGGALLEQFLLSAFAGALGLWTAWIGLVLFTQSAATNIPRLQDATLDVRAMAFAVAVTGATAVVVALLPAWRLARGGTLPVLRATSVAITGDSVARRSHAVLLTLQVALSVSLLVVTALFVVSFTKLLNSDRGFVPDRVLAVDVALPAARYADEPVRQSVYDRLLSVLHAVPGVESVTTTSMLPLRGHGQVNSIALPGQTLRDDLSQMPGANFRFVAPGFFRTLGIEVRRGRSFTDAERDPNRPAPALISEPTAARLWPGENPLGKRFSRGIPTEQGFEVVGVVADARTTALDSAQPLMVYAPYWWRSRATASLLIRTHVDDAAALLPSVRRVVREIDPEIAIGDARPLTDIVDASMAGRRHQTQLFVAFGSVALFIAVIGIYAVMSFTILQRRREMNIRVALGAPRRQVIGQMLRQGMTPVLVGIVAGVGGALAVGNLVASLLFDVEPRDPMIITGVVAIVLSVGLATCGTAVRRGLSIDPALALRDE